MFDTTIFFAIAIPTLIISYGFIVRAEIRERKAREARKSAWKTNKN